MTQSTNNGSADGNPLKQFTAFAQDGLELVQQEIHLARQETIEKLTPAVQGGGMVLAGGLLSVIGSSYLADAIVHLLATWMPRWLASFVFGTGLTAGGLVLMRRGSSDIKNLDLVPTKTINSLREDKEWLLNQIKSRLI